MISARRMSRHFTSSYEGARLAAITARTISRMMKTRGFQMADTSNSNKWTTGWVVGRVGASSTVSVMWWNATNNFSTWGKPVLREKEAQVRQWLVNNGWDIDTRLGGVNVKGDVPRRPKLPKEAM